MDSKREPNGRPRPPGPESARRPSDHPPKKPRSPFASWRTWGLLLVFVLLNTLLAPILVPDTSDRVTVPYTVFKQQVTAGNVSEITSRGDAIQGTFRQPVTVPLPGQPEKTATGTKFDTRAPSFPDQDLIPLLERQNVVVNARPLEEARSWWLSLVISVLPGLLIFG